MFLSISVKVFKNHFCTTRFVQIQADGNSFGELLSVRVRDRDRDHRRWEKGGLEVKIKGQGL